MKIIIYQNREVYKENSKIGNDSENNVETLEFEFPEEYKDFTKYIEFQIKGEKYVDLIENNKYVITKSVAKYGKIKAQVVLKKNNSNDTEIFKSDMFTLTVSNSINATESLANKVEIDFIKKLVSKNNEQDSRLNTLETDNTTNSEILSNLKIDNETNKTDILNLKQDQTMLNTNISNLVKDNISNKAKIESLELKDTEQDTNIQKNTESIDSINKKDTEQDKEIEELKTKDTNQDNLIEELQEENKELKLENSLIKEQIPNGNIVGDSIHIEDSSNLEMSLKLNGGHRQETNDNSPSPDYPSEIETVKDSVTVEICNKNLFDKNNVNKFLGYIDENGNLNEGDKSRKTLYIKCKADTNYAVSKIISSRFRVGTFKTIENTSHMISGVFDDNSEKTALTINSGDGAIYLAVTYYAGGIDTLSEEEILDSIQIEESSTATDYISHQSQSIRIPVQQEMLEGDYIEEVEHHEWGKVLLDGKNHVALFKHATIYTDTRSFFQFRIMNKKGQYGNANRMICDSFKLSTGTANQAIIKECIWDEGGMYYYISINKDRLETDDTAGMNKYLRKNPITIYYKLAEPLDLELTSEQKAIKEKKLYTYKNITNIDIDNELASLDVTYKKDIETYEKRISVLESVVLGGE